MNKQVESAFTASRARADEIALLEYLDFLEISLPDCREPFREKLSVWITLVRKEVKRFPPHLRVLMSFRATAGMMILLIGGRTMLGSPSP